MPPPYPAPAYQPQPVQPPPQQASAAAPADNSVGQVATVQGSATVMRANAAVAVLQVSDPIFKDDTLETGANSALGVTFDDETTFSLSADTRIVVNEFVYEDGGSGNAASFNVAIGTAAFVASLVAKTGNMTITTPEAAIGIRGTTGVVEVPAAGGTAAPTVKLYPDADGHVGQIDLFDRQGNRLGALTQGASAFTIRRGAGGRLIAQPYRIPPQEAARDRGVLQRLNVTHTIGRQLLNQRRQLRGPNRQGPNNQRRQGGPQNFRPGGQQIFGRMVRKTSAQGDNRILARAVRDRSIVRREGLAGRDRAGRRTTTETDKCVRRIRREQKWGNRCGPIKYPRAAPASSWWSRSSVQIPSRAIARCW